jgi:ABC-type amino acid transport substrate-binding protein
VAGPISITVRALENGSPGPASNAIAFDYYRDSTDRIVATGQIVAAVHTDRSDGLFCYEAGDSFEGFDVDLLAALAQTLTTEYKKRKIYPQNAPPIRAKLVRFGWPEILDEPAKMEAVDLAIASISITEARERERRIYFSKPYWETNLGAVQPGAISSPFSLDELRGKRVGVHQDTTALAFIRGQIGRNTTEADIVKAVDNADLFSKLRNGLIDVALYDYDRAIPEVKANPGWTARVMKDGQREQYGIMFARINARLRDDVNAALDTLSARIPAMMKARRGDVQPPPARTGAASTRPMTAAGGVENGAPL